MKRHGFNAISLDRGISANRREYLNENLLFFLFNALLVVAFFNPLKALIETSWNSDYYTYIPFVPVISAYCIHRRRTAIFSLQEPAPGIGLLIMIAGSTALLIGGENRQAMPGSSDHLAKVTLSVVTLWVGGFTLRYGKQALREAAFPLLFLFLAVPIPAAVAERLIVFLQTGSAHAADALFRLSGMPVAREGFVFYLPSFTVEVAPQCSGIRSFLALLITGLLAGQFFLRTGIAKTLLTASLIPIAMVKNGFRIFTLSALGTYFDENIFTSPLHHKGGAVFFALALLLAGAVTVLLSRLEKRLPPNGAKCLF